MKIYGSFDIIKDLKVGETITIEGDGYVKLPEGPTSTRPVPPNKGMIRFNTDWKLIELYDGTTWRIINPERGFTGSQGFTGSFGFTGSQGFTGSAGDSFNDIPIGTNQFVYRSENEIEGTQNLFFNPISNGIVMKDIFESFVLKFETMGMGNIPLFTAKLSSFRSIKLIIQVENVTTGRVQFSEKVVIHDDNDIYVSEYGVISSDPTTYTAFNYEKVVDEFILFVNKPNNNHEKYKLYLNKIM